MRCASFSLAGSHGAAGSLVHWRCSCTASRPSARAGPGPACRKPRNFVGCGSKEGCRDTRPHRERARHAEFCRQSDHAFHRIPFSGALRGGVQGRVSGGRISAPYDFPATKSLSRRGGGGRSFCSTRPWVTQGGRPGLCRTAGPRSRFRPSIDQALDYARVLHCPQIHVLAGQATGDRAEQEEVYVGNLRRAAAPAPPRKA